MKYENGICKGCGFPRLIVNKKYYLCDKCNKERLHGKFNMHEKPPDKPLKRWKKKKYDKHPNKVAMRSDKRKIEEQWYADKREQKRADLIEKDAYRCFFCNAKLDPEEDVACHHINGRIGKLLYHYPNLSFAHHNCHREWHDEDAHKLVKQKWFHYFEERVERRAKAGDEVHIKLHNTIAMRLFKAGIYDSEIYFNKLI